jgi:hypothetical protein
VGRVVRGASCPWGELSWGELSMGRVVHGARCLGASFDGASCPWGELSWGEWSGNRSSLCHMANGQVCPCPGQSVVYLGLNLLEITL